MLLPEFYLPHEWIKEVLRFVEKTGMTIISGLQYKVINGYAHNYVALFAPIYSGQFGNFINSCILVREKNDYAPMEINHLALHGVKCVDQKKPLYQIISQNGFSYGLFLCYEFTDICARSLYKNEVDALFTPEYNKDTAYFSSIIESLSRDLHSFIIQSNTSIYGDSRITGPYSKNSRNIVQIKGGENNELIISEIDIPGLRQFQKEEKKKMNAEINKRLNYNEKERKEELEKLDEEKPCISKFSARFKRGI